MTFNTQLPVFRPRVILFAIASVAALATVSLLLASSAGAASGGIGTIEEEPRSGGSGAGEPSNQNVNPAKYKRLWNRVAPVQKRWARSTSECESGGDPDAIGYRGQYRGAFQFTTDTWDASPKSPGGDPTDFSYVTQAVVAVALKKRDGAGHWPVCG